MSASRPNPDAEVAPGGAPLGGPREQHFIARVTPSVALTSSAGAGRGDLRVTASRMSEVCGYTTSRSSEACEQSIGLRNPGVDGIRSDAREEDLSGIRTRPSTPTF